VLPRRYKGSKARDFRGLEGFPRGITAFTALLAAGSALFIAAKKEDTPEAYLKKTMYFYACLKIPILRKMQLLNRVGTLIQSI